MLHVDAGSPLLKNCKPLKAVKRTAIILPGAILKSEFLFLLF
jgi:hypothetical protein